MGRRFILIAAALVIVLLIVFQWSLSFEPDKPKLDAFGGQISLIDQRGKPFELSAVAGSHALLFFGFTHCPDVCPTGLQKMSDLMAGLPQGMRDKLVPIFITVDPARDTSSVLLDYLSSFSPAIIGLTGTEDQIADVAKRYAIYFEKMPPMGADPQQYMVNHTGHFILLDPQGNFIKVYDSHQKTEDMIRDLAVVMGR